MIIKLVRVQRKEEDMERKTYREAVETIVDFLCHRDVEKLDDSTVKTFFGGKCADVVIVFGNDLPGTAEAGCEAWKQGLGEWLLFCGGIGHSTEILRSRMEREACYNACRKEGSEAELFAEIAVHRYKIPRKRILLDTKSTNCGENAKNARTVLEASGIRAERMILMQDPLMQRRSFMGLREAMPDTAKILSFAPFLPRLAEDGEVSDGRDRVRFLELLLGEIRRLRDDEHGYGPRGAGFIGHVDIPERVEEAWNILYEAEAEARKRC